MTLIRSSAKNILQNTWRKLGLKWSNVYDKQAWMTPQHNLVQQENSLVYYCSLFADL